MIQLSLQSGFELYVAVLLGLLVFLGIIDSIRQNAQNWAPSREELGYCRRCNCAILVPGKQATATCPRCGNPVVAHDRPELT